MPNTLRPNDLAFFDAIRNKSKERVENLLQAEEPPDIRARNKEGLTGAHFAAKNAPQILALLAEQDKSLLHLEASSDFIAAKKKEKRAELRRIEQEYLRSMRDWKRADNTLSPQIIAQKTEVNARKMRRLLATSTLTEQLWAHYTPAAVALLTSNIDSLTICLQHNAAQAEFLLPIVDEWLRLSTNPYQIHFLLRVKELLALEPLFAAIANLKSYHQEHSEDQDEVADLTETVDYINDRAQRLIQAILNEEDTTNQLSALTSFKSGSDHEDPLPRLLNAIAEIAENLSPKPKVDPITIKFFEAIRDDEVPTVERLLEEGFDVDTIDPVGVFGPVSMGGCALLYVASQGSEAMREVILSYNPKLDVSCQGITAGLVAAMNPDSEVFASLVEAGVSPTALIPEVLKEPIQNCEKREALALQAYFAETRRQDSSPQDLEQAEQAWRQSMTSEGIQKQLLSSLIPLHILIALRNPEALTKLLPYYKTVDPTLLVQVKTLIQLEKDGHKRSKFEAIDRLLTEAYGLSELPSQPNTEELSLPVDPLTADEIAFLRAVEEGDVAAAEALLSSSTDIDIDVEDPGREAVRSTALLCALDSGNPVMVSLLLQNGANPSLCTTAGVNALSVAIKRGASLINPAGIQGTLILIKSLIAHGALAGDQTIAMAALTNAASLPNIAAKSFRAMVGNLLAKAPLLHQLNSALQAIEEHYAANPELPDEEVPQALQAARNYTGSLIDGVANRSPYLVNTLKDFQQLATQKTAAPLLFANLAEAALAVLSGQAEPDLSHIAIPEDKLSQKEIIFWDAVVANDIGRVLDSLSGPQAVNPNVADPTRDIPNALLHTIRHDHLKMAVALLEQGASMDEPVAPEIKEQFEQDIEHKENNLKTLLTSLVPKLSPLMLSLFHGPDFFKLGLQYSTLPLSEETITTFEKMLPLMPQTAENEANQRLLSKASGFQSLFAAIRDLDSYAKVLCQDKDSKAFGEEARQLVITLKEQAASYMDAVAANDVEQIKALQASFQPVLAQGAEVMGRHRQEWIDILINILLAASVVGLIAIAINGGFFHRQTEREKRFHKVLEAQENLQLQTIKVPSFFKPAEEEAEATAAEVSPETSPELS